MPLRRGSDFALRAGTRISARLTYTPRGVDVGGWHPIDVRLKGRRGNVTARRGYLK